jgi:fatty acid desaturase
MTAWLMWTLVGLGIWFALSVISAFLVGHLLSHRGVRADQASLEAAQRFRSASVA